MNDKENDLELVLIQELNKNPEETVVKLEETYSYLNERIHDLEEDSLVVLNPVECNSIIQLDFLIHMILQTVKNNFHSLSFSNEMKVTIKEYCSSCLEKIPELKDLQNKNIDNPDMNVLKIIVNFELSDNSLEVEDTDFYKSEEFENLLRLNNAIC